MLDSYVLDAINTLDATETPSEALPYCLTETLKNLAGVDQNATLELS